MGYTSEFYGEITIEPPLNGDEIAFLTAFAEERHEDDPAAPGIWCQWVPRAFGSVLAWDEGEKFYNAAEWMAYLIDHFLKPGATAQGATDETDRYGRVVSRVRGTVCRECATRYLEDEHGGRTHDDEELDDDHHPVPDNRFELFGFNHVLNGVIEVQGEDADDRWLLTVTDNQVFTQDVNYAPSGTPQRVS